MKIIGHRGAKGLAPENTIKSFEKALEHNVDMIETDVHITLDNIPVLEHDAHMKNQGGESFLIADHDFAFLKKHKPELITLEEGISFIDRRVPFYLEVKERQPVGAVITVVEAFIERGWQPSDFLFASHDYGVLKALHAAYPNIAVVVGEDWSATRATWRARKLGTKLLSMQHRWLWRGLIRFMSRRGWKIYAFTMNDTPKARRFERYGVYAIFTDYPDQF